MAFLKEFGQRLAELGEQQGAEKLARERKARDEEEVVVHAEAEKLASEELERKTAQKVKLLREELEETFKPILETVNESYLKGNGKLEEEAQKDGSSMTVRLSWVVEVDLSAELDQIRKDFRRIEIKKSIESETVELKCGKDCKEEFMTQDENWKEQLFGAIETALRENRCSHIRIY